MLTNKHTIIAAKSRELCADIAGLLDVPEADRVLCDSGIFCRALDVSRTELLIISTPLSDEFGLDLAADLYREQGGIGIVILTKSEFAEEIQRKLRFCGAFVLARPVSRQLLQNTARFAVIAAERSSKLREENRQLSEKLEEQRVVFQAKLKLIAESGCSETEAHKLLQRAAMDGRLTLLEQAKSVISN